MKCIEGKIECEGWGIVLLWLVYIVINKFLFLVIDDVMVILLCVLIVNLWGKKF